MARCDLCGNEYDKAFTVTQGNVTRTFDSFECAIHVMAPVCAHCGCRIVGHGIDIVAIHQHMIDEEPRIVFLHYWGIGPAEDLAKGLRAALDRTGNSQKTPK